MTELRPWVWCLPFLEHGVQSDVADRAWNKRYSSLELIISKYWKLKHVSKVIWQKAASPTCHPRGYEWIRPILILMVPWTHKSQLPNGMSIGSAVYVGQIRETNIHTVYRQTDRHITLRVTSVATGRLYAMHVVLSTNQATKIFSQQRCSLITAQIENSWLQVLKVRKIREFYAIFKIRKNT